MYGDILPGDKTHDDVIRLYQHHFNMAFQHMPKKFEDKSKFEVWQMCCEIFQVSYRDLMPLNYTIFH